MKKQDTSPQWSLVRSSHLATFGTAILSALGFWSQPASAQDAPPPSESAAPTTAPAEAPTSAPIDSTEAPAPSVAPPAQPETKAIVAEPAEAAPAAEEKEEKEETKAFEPSFTVGAGLRTGLDLVFGDEPTLRLNDGLVDQINIRPFMSGSLTPAVGYWVSFEIGTAKGLGHFAILDAIAQIKFLDELQLWVGQHIPAGDRNNMNGPFFGNTWNFAIAAGGYPFDAGARDRGLTLWGLIAGGFLKYHFSVVDLQGALGGENRTLSQARIGGRLDLQLLEPDKSYYNSGTYFGAQDTLTIGASFQRQKGDADVPDDNLFGFTVDGMFEKNFGAAGTLTAEVGYFNYEKTGANYVSNQYTVDTGLGVNVNGVGSGFLGILSWLSPGKVGYGKLQPNARYQYGNYGAETHVIDVGLAYVIDGFNHKYHLNYRHADIAGEGVDSIQFGFQLMASK